jgi:hypothetical protein
VAPCCPVHTLTWASIHKVTIFKKLSSLFCWERLMARGQGCFLLLAPARLLPSQSWLWAWSPLKRSLLPSPLLIGPDSGAPATVFPLYFDWPSFNFLILWHYDCWPTCLSPHWLWVLDDEGCGFSSPSICTTPDLPVQHLLMGWRWMNCVFSKAIASTIKCFLLTRSQQYVLEGTHAMTQLQFP